MLHSELMVKQYVSYRLLNSGLNYAPTFVIIKLKHLGSPGCTVSQEMYSQNRYIDVCFQMFGFGDFLIDCHIPSSITNYAY